MAKRDAEGRGGGKNRNTDVSTLPCAALALCLGPLGTWCAHFYGRKNLQNIKEWIEETHYGFPLTLFHVALDFKVGVGQFVLRKDIFTIPMGVRTVFSDSPLPPPPAISSDANLGGCGGT